MRRLGSLWAVKILLNVAIAVGLVHSPMRQITLLRTIRNQLALFTNEVLTFQLRLPACVTYDTENRSRIRMILLEDSLKLFLRSMAPILDASFDSRSVLPAVLNRQSFRKTYQALRSDANTSNDILVQAV